MVDAREQAETAAKEVGATLQRVRAVEVLGHDPLAHTFPRAFIRLTQPRDEQHERGDEVVDVAVALGLATLAYAAVVGVDITGKVVRKRHVEQVVRAQ